MQIREAPRAVIPLLDDVDNRIIEILRDNGRATNLEIAERLGVTAATVSSRIRRLEENKAMRVVAVSDFAAHGFDILIALGIKVRGRDVEDVAHDLSLLPEVFSINVMNGRFDLELLVALRAFDEIGTFLIEKIAVIDGVDEMDPAIAADIVKFEFNVAPL